MASEECGSDRGCFPHINGIAFWALPCTLQFIVDPLLSKELILSSDFTRSALLINTIISLGIRANGVKMSVGVLVLLMGIGLMGGCGKHLGELCESYLSGKPRTWDCWLRERHTCKVSHMHQPILFPAMCACILNGGCFRKLSHLDDLAFHKSSFLVPNGF